MKEDRLAKALSIIRLKGPVIPSEVNKNLEVDVMLGSAILSELVDKGDLKISNIRVGNSPLYYAPGQEDKLQQFSNHLNSKDRETYELLKQKKVLKDSSMEPLRRVSLRQIKDFAKPLNVKVNGETILFWKWYLISNDEAAEIIKTMLPKKEVKEDIKSNFQEAEKRHSGKTDNEAKGESGQESPEKPAEKKDAGESGQKESREKKEGRGETQSKLSEDKKEEGGEETEELPKDKFFRKIKRYFDDNNIKIKDFKINRKESDIEFTIEIPSTVGALNYFCKARNKKKFNDGDLSSVFYEGQKRKMPVLFLITGELTKKAKDVLESEFTNMSVKNI